MLSQIVQHGRRGVPVAGFSEDLLREGIDVPDAEAIAAYLKASYPVNQQVDGTFTQTTTLATAPLLARASLEKWNSSETHLK